MLFKPVRKILRQRKEKIDGLEENIESFQKDAQEKDESYLLGMKEARSKGLGEKEKLFNIQKTGHQYCRNKPQKS